MHQDDPAGTAIDDGRHRHRDCVVPDGGRHFDLGEHARFKKQSGVRQFDPNLHRARFGLERRIGVRDFAFKDLVRVSVDPDLCLGAGLDQADILLENIGDDPDRRKIRDLVQRVAWHEPHALYCLLLGHDAGDRRAERHGPFRFPRFRQRLDLFLGYIPILQAHQARFGQLHHVRLRCGSRRLERLHTLRGDRIFPLHRHQLGTVDLEQRLPFANRLSSRVDMQAFHVAFELGSDRVEAPFVRLDAPGRAHDFFNRPHAGRFRLHAELLDFFGTDLDLTGSGGVWVGIILALPDCDIVHAHRVLLRHRRGVGQAHRVAIVQQLAWFFRAADGATANRRGTMAAGLMTLAREVTAARRDGGHDEHADDDVRTLFQRSSPKSFSMSARRTWASACTLIRFCFAWRICRCASSKVAKSTLPFS